MSLIKKNLHPIQQIFLCKFVFIIYHTKNIRFLIDIIILPFLWWNTFIFLYKIRYNN